MTADSNIALYAFSQTAKADIADVALHRSDFLSAQVLSEYAWVSKRKFGLNWREIARDLELIRGMVPQVKAIEPDATGEALRLAERYELNYFDALMIAVALANGATTLYSEDMQHGLVVDGTLTITNPFLPMDPA